MNKSECFKTKARKRDGGLVCDSSGMNKDRSLCVNKSKAGRKLVCVLDIVLSDIVPAVCVKDRTDSLTD